MISRQIEIFSQAKDAYHFTKYRRLFRQVTPRELKFFENFEEILEAFVDDPLNREKEVAVQTLNIFFHSSVMLFKRSRLHISESTKGVREFARIKYLVDYGDYMADGLRTFKAQAKEKESEGVESLTGLKWTAVHEQLERESDRMRWYLRGHLNSRPEQKMTYTIKDACDKLIIDYNNMVSCISFYSERNKACHNMVSEKVERCDWEALGKQLYRDRAEIPAIFQGDEQRNMTEALNRVAKRYFTKVSPVNSEPSKLAVQLRLELLKRQVKKGKNKLAAMEKKEKSEKRKATLGRKKVRVADRLEREKENKKAARVSRATTDRWTEDDEDFGMGGLF
ncbi:MAG: hypothetical protein L6R42_002427 [Xanthoria sp. 1 TBL-2021]|nr:MAG: hypothetical protein L6R42_002427 [Xanthoria sp. 1 TBL-2021]